MKELNLRDGFMMAGHNWKMNEYLYIVLAGGLLLQVVALSKVTNAEGFKYTIFRLVA